MGRLATAEEHLLRWRQGQSREPISSTGRWRKPKAKRTWSFSVEFKWPWACAVAAGFAPLRSCSPIGEWTCENEEWPYSTIHPSYWYWTTAWTYQPVTAGREEVNFLGRHRHITHLSLAFGQNDSPRNLNHPGHQGSERRPIWTSYWICKAKFGRTNWKNTKISQFIWLVLSRRAHPVVVRRCQGAASLKRSEAFRSQVIFAVKRTHQIFEQKAALKAHWLHFWLFWLVLWVERLRLFTSMYWWWSSNQQRLLKILEWI